MKKIVTISAIALVCAMSVQARNSTIAEHRDHPTKEEKKSISISPNRSTGDISVNYTSAVAEDAQIEVKDATGKTVLTQTSAVKAGQNKINIDKFGTLSEGQYSIQLKAGKILQTTSFLLWK